MSTSAHKIIPVVPMNTSYHYHYTFRFEEEFDSANIKPYIDTHWKVVVFTSLGEKEYDQGLHG